MLGVCSIQAAQAENTRIEYEYQKKIDAANTMAHLSSTSFGNQTDEATGRTIFSTFDVDLPGNNDLPVRFGRRLGIDYRFVDQELGGLGNWDVEVPYIEGTFSDLSGWTVGSGTASYRYNRCSHPDVPAVEGGSFTPYEVWHGYNIHVPGVLDDSLMIDTTTNVDPTDGNSYPWILKSFDRIGCLPSLKNGQAGEGFVLLTKTGARYYFDFMVERKANTLRKGSKGCAGEGQSLCASLSMKRKRLYLLATRIEDRFGNHVDYQYDATGRPLSITANDGRAISVQYSSNAIVVSASGRSWRYSLNNGQLVSVKSPDNSEWKYSPYGMPTQVIGWDVDGGPDNLPLEYFSPDSDCLYSAPAQYGSGLFDFQVTHPSGAVANFTFDGHRFYRSGVLYQCEITYTSSDGTQGAAHVTTPNYFGVYSLAKLSISGPGVPVADTTYEYSIEEYPYCDAISSVTGEYVSPRCNEDPCSQGDCSDPVGRWVTETRPDGTKQRRRFGVIYAINEGRLLAEETLDSSGGIVRSVEYQYVPDGVLGSQVFPFYPGIPISSDPMKGRVQPLVSTQVLQEGVLYKNEVPICSGQAYCFDAFAQATKFRKSNALGAEKTEVIEYENSLGNWVIGQIKKRYTTNANLNNDPSALSNVLAEEVVYDAKSLPWKTYRYGKLQQTLTYNADGTLATAADGAGNTATYSSWKRGLPQSITNPDFTTQSATVDDNGWITAVTDENGYVTGYGYDAMGRLASVIYPTGDTLAGGATAYHGTWANYRALTSADWKPAGVSNGQWRKLEGTGDHILVTYYDAMWRPVLTNEYDQNNVTPTLRAVRTEYDTSGRKSFESYPSSSGVPGATGIRTYYDALDRVKRVEQDSELGVLTTMTEYLAGLKTRVTNPRGKQTTTSFMAWDRPSYDLPILSELPEGKVIQIARHPQFGWPLSMTQRNAANTLSQTRKYVYDGNAQLCKTIEPETRVTVTGYDAAGNPSWSAAGLDANAYASTTDCQHATAYASGRVSTRTYDTRNRLSVLDFPDHRGKQVWTYTPDGKPASITVYNLANDPQPVITAYNYNHRRLLTGETLTQQNWYSWTMGYAYDAYGNLASQTYPTGLTVAYAPNPLGQATQAGSYATGAQYYPNGALKQFTYGNGIVHTMTQNTRQLLSQVTSSGTTNYTYNYDADGNITNIWDLARGDNYSRWMTYDDLDRLTSAGSASFGGDAWHRFTYDALDNLSSWKLAGVKDYAEYVYDPQKNQLTNIRNTAGASVVGLGYDLQGNVSNKNGQTYDFDYGNRLRTVANKESYRYDGLGRRVQSTATDGSKTTTWQYTQSGQMAFSSDWVAPGQSNQKTHENVYLAGSVVAIIDHDWPSNAVIATKYQHTDALGSPVAVTNAAGTVTERNDYEPYGAVIGKPTYSGIGYTGHVMDGGTGLTYMQQRYYDSSIGRFLSVDPLAANANTGAMFNRYNYAKNNPYGYVDPDGRTCTSNADKKGVTCKFDNPNGLTGKRLDDANRAYTRAVNRLLNNPGRKVELSASSAAGTKVSTTTTAGKIADVLIKANVKYGGDSPALASLGGGKANAVTDAGPAGVRITLFTEGLKSESAQGKTMIHEGAHGTEEGQGVRDASNSFNFLRFLTGAENFQQSHQQSFKGASTELFDNYDK